MPARKAERPGWHDEALYAVLVHLLLEAQGWLRDALRFNGRAGGQDSLSRRTCAPRCGGAKGGQDRGGAGGRGGTGGCGTGNRLIGKE